MTEDCLFEVLGEALAARVIEELAQSVDRYQFTHALIQETLFGELSTTRKVRLHARIAQALEELYGDDADAHAAESALMEINYGPDEGLSRIALDRLLGLLCLTGNQLTEAIAHFEKAMAFCRNAGYRPKLAWTCCDYADALKEQHAERCLNCKRVINRASPPSGVGSRVGKGPRMPPGCFPKARSWHRKLAGPSLPCRCV